MPRISSTVRNDIASKIDVLHSEGVSQRKIAEQLGATRGQVRCYLNSRAKPKVQTSSAISTAQSDIAVQAEEQAKRLLENIAHATVRNNLVALAKLENEFRANMKLRNEINQQTNNATQLNDASIAQIRSLVSDILKAIAPHPEAKEAIEEALSRFTERNAID